MCASLSAGVCWAALRPCDTWGTDFECARSHAEPVVVLVASPDRPLCAPTRAAVDAAWNELRPRAQRVIAERAPTSLGGASALSLCVFRSTGELVARRDGALDAASAEEWLLEALDAATNEAPRSDRAYSNLGSLFEHAQRALRLGVVEQAEREFTALASSPELELQCAARERLARIAIERGDVSLAREQWTLAARERFGAAGSARVLFTRGLIELAERKNREASATLEDAQRELENVHDADAERACFEAARARAACGEESLAIATLDALSRRASSHSQREAARRLAEDLRSPPSTH